jgi:tetratricopeptide (TPR) repeat protein
MSKLQIALIVLAALATLGLYSLPKVVVKNDTIALSNDNAAESSPSTEGMHTLSLTESQESQLSRLQKAKEAAASLEDSILWNDSLAHFFIGLNKWDSAGFFYAENARLQPGVAAWMKAGNTYYEAFTFALDASKANRLGEKARGFYEQVLAKEPNYFEAKTKMGMTYVSTSNPMQGIQMILEVARQDPGNELALFNLGILALERNDPATALKRFEELLASHPNNVQAWVYLAECQEQLGNKAESREALEKVLTLDISEEMRKQIRQHLDKSSVK